MTHRIPAAVAAGFLLVAACDEAGHSPAGTDAAPPDATASRALGEDGAFTVSAPNTVLNAYSALGADAPAGSATLVLSTAGQLDLPAPSGPLGPGDLLLVVQMQGATLDSSNSPGFGAVTDYRSAGLYEYVIVGAVNGATIDLASACNGLRNAYVAADGAQVIRVPTYQSLTIEGLGSVVAMPWDGTRGGVVALHVLDALVVDGGIDASAAGFRGGIVEQTSTGGALDNTTWRSVLQEDGGDKGESIAGFGADYDAAGGRFGRAAPANGGGGGTSHNAGGGGGANGDNGLPWTGQGVMDAATTGAAAWTLDPGYVANGNSLTNSSGGGRGGYTFAAANQDALTDAPGTPSWGGNSRRERGGLGGRPLPHPVSERVFLGGGGGAGDSNNGAGGGGGRGGGLVMIVAGSVDGAGSIRADGADGVNTIPGHNDAPGGGGGGGTIVVESRSILGVTFSADGGNGGNQLITDNESEGPGGGGGGGRVAMNTGVPTRTTAGGSGGVTTSQSLTEFPANGSTMGASGVEDEVFTLGDIQGCRPLDVSVTKTDSRDRVPRGARTIYVIEVSIDSDAAGTQDIVVQDPLPAGIETATWTCEATLGSTCDEPSGIGPIDTTVDLVGGGVATFTVNAILASDAPDFLTNTVTVSAPGDDDPSNDTAADTNEITAGYGVAGTGCGCRVDGGGRAGGSFALLLALAGFVARRRRRA